MRHCGQEKQTSAGVAILPAESWPETYGSHFQLLSGHLDKISATYVKSGATGQTGTGGKVLQCNKPGNMQYERENGK